MKRDSYQIDPLSYKKEGKPKKIVVEERLDGKMVLMDGDRELKYQAIQERPKQTPKKKVLSPRKQFIPPVDHPWRKWNAVFKKAA